jgi:CubicO group peptidase (beta-lactamase class C family)
VEFPAFPRNRADSGVSRGTGGIAELPEAVRSLRDVVVPRLDGSHTTVGAVVATTYTDGFMVMHEGRVIAEEYPAGMAPDALHLVMSVTKSLVGSVAAVLVDQGVLDPAAPLTTYVPALAVSGYAGATVRHVLDMRSGIIFSENYLDPDAEVRLLQQCIGWSPRRDPTSPASMYDFLVTLKQGSPHGGPFDYRSCETDVLGWLCEQANFGCLTPTGTFCSAWGFTAR